MTTNLKFHNAIVWPEYEMQVALLCHC